MLAADDRPVTLEIRRGRRLSAAPAMLAAACLMMAASCATTGSDTGASGNESDAGLVADGRTFASLKCGGCHALDQSELSPSWGAPPMKRLLPRLEFKMLERQPPQDAMMTHGDMPPLHLSLLEKDALVAYLKSLAGPPAK